MEARPDGPGPANGLHRELGSYSHIMFDGDRTFYISGQVPLTPAGDLVGDDAAAQARQVFANLAAALAAMNLDTHDVVKLTTYLTDRAHAAAFAATRDEFLAPPYPASAVVLVSGLLDARWKLEVEAIAVRS
jgi:enamine deaminase RidA (YjgF/YER057c/UK114 family)